MTTIKKQKKIDVAIGATRSKLAVIVREILKLEAKVAANKHLNKNNQNE